MQNDLHNTCMSSIEKRHKRKFGLNFYSGRARRNTLGTLLGICANPISLKQSTRRDSEKHNSRSLISNYVLASKINSPIRLKHNYFKPTLACQKSAILFNPNESLKANSSPKTKNKGKRIRYSKNSKDLESFLSITTKPIISSRDRSKTARNIIQQITSFETCQKNHLSSGTSSKAVIDISHIEVPHVAKEHYHVSKFTSIDAINCTDISAWEIPTQDE